MKKQMNYQVLLYYHYVSLEDPEKFAADHLKFCKSFKLAA